MAAVYPANKVGIISQMVLNLTVSQANALHDNGWDDVTDFEGYAKEDIKSWMSSTACLAVNRGGVVFPSTKVIRVYALAC